MFQVIWAVQKCFVIYSKILQPKGFNFSLIWIHFHNLTEITFRYFHYISLFLRYVCWRYLTYSCEIYWGNLFCRLNRSSRMTWKILLNLENAVGPWNKFKLFKLMLNISSFYVSSILRQKYFLEKQSQWCLHTQKQLQ